MSSVHGFVAVLARVGLALVLAVSGEIIPTARLASSLCAYPYIDVRFDGYWCYVSHSSRVDVLTASSLYPYYLFCLRIVLLNISVQLVLWTSFCFELPDSVKS